MQRFVIFRLGEETYGLPIEDVEAVIRLPQTITRVPGAPPFVAGVISHRGRVTPLVDQAMRFSSGSTAQARRRVIVASLDGLTAGFIVDAVDQVASIPQTALQATPQLANGEAGVFDRVATVEHGGALVLLVDPRQLLDQAERDILSALAAGANGEGPAGRVIKLLVVDDSPLMRRLLGELFAAEGDFQLAFARDGVEALQALRDDPPDVITLDVQMPEMDGLACLDRIMLERPTPVVMASSLTLSGADEALRAIELGAVDVIAKPAGAVSLRMAEFGPALIDKVRAAAGARLPTARRLAERMRARTANRVAPSQPPTPRAIAHAPPHPATGQPPVEGLVIIGCSTGGPPALDAVLSVLPADLPWPVVIAQHMPASFTGSLARRLDALAPLAVSEVSEPTVLQAGGAYLARGDADLILSRRREGLTALNAPADPAFRWHPSVERLTRSALAVMPPRHIVGVLMTGMGNDGAMAMAQLHAEGGQTIAQSESTSVVWGMPGELVRAGGASQVEDLERIGRRIGEAIARAVAA